jgi:hypothetical protein
MVFLKKIKIINEFNILITQTNLRLCLELKTTQNYTSQKKIINIKKLYFI